MSRHGGRCDIFTMRAHCKLWTMCAGSTEVSIVQESRPRHHQGVLRCRHTNQYIRRVTVPELKVFISVNKLLYSNYYISNDHYLREQSVYVLPSSVGAMCNEIVYI